jgi:branched-chain amino acid transport system ATP-binding protein
VIAGTNNDGIPLIAYEKGRPVLELHHVSKRYSGIAAVENASFSTPPEEVTGCLGANGSGKSSTLKMIKCIA